MLPVCAFYHQSTDILRVHSRVTDPAMSEIEQSPRVHIRPQFVKKCIIIPIFCRNVESRCCSQVERDANFVGTKVGDWVALVKLTAEQWFEP